jgi:UDP-glucose 4-epimerase
MNALVTGGAGFIGSSVVREVLSHGGAARVLDDLSTGHEDNLAGLDVHLVRGDVRDRDLVCDCLAGVDTVFHLAASIGNVKSLADPAEDASVNAVGTATLLDACRKAGVRRVVYSSSAATFGELITMPIAEDHPQNPDSPYGVSKLAAEKYVLCFGRLYGMQAVCLRYFNVYGVRQRYDAYGNVIPIFAERLLAGKALTIYGDGEQTRDFVNVKDVARANHLAATVNGAGGVYNIGSGTSVTIARLAELAQEASGVRAVAVTHAPPRMGEVRHCCADIRRAGESLGFKPGHELGDGLVEYFKWFKGNQTGCSATAP